MADIRSRIFAGGVPPTADLNLYADDLYGSINQSVDHLAAQVYTSVTGANVPLKPFVIGFIPPDVAINYVAVEQDKTQFATAESTVQGQSASAGASGPMELAPTKTVFTQKALGNSVYKALKKRGFSEADARRLTPLLVGQARAEISPGPNGTFSTTCFNIGNVHSKGPGQGGYYYRGKDKRGNSEAGYRPGGDNSYDTYFVAATNLDDGADRWVGATLGWRNVRNAQSGQDFARALRPDLFPESKGGNNGAYFTAGKSADDPDFLAYGRNIDAGASMYRQQVKDPSEPDPGGIIAGGENSLRAYNDVPGVTNKAADRGFVGVMGDSATTTEEEDDPIGGRTGRNIRQADAKRREAVNRQLQEIQAQAQAISNTPALYMLVNPQTFTRGHEHTADAVKVRRGTVVHTWLEKPMTLTGKGVTAAQYIIDSQGFGGLTNVNRVHSLAYRNLMSLVRVYKNNGWIFSGGAAGEGNNGIPLIALSIYIYYDGQVYIGSFDDFSVTDSGDKPYNLEYSFKFTVRYSVEAGSVTDADVSGAIANGFISGGG